MDAGGVLKQEHVGKQHGLKGQGSVTKNLSLGAVDRLRAKVVAAIGSDPGKSRHLEDCLLEVDTVKALLLSNEDSSVGREDEWVSELDRSIRKHTSLSGLFSSRVTVYAVPKHLKRICPVDYEPEQFKFGLHNRFLPYHGIERMKIDVAREFMRYKGIRDVYQWKNFTELIVRDAEEVRHCYEVLDVPLVQQTTLLVDQDRRRRLFSGLESDDIVRNVLTMDAVFLVVFLQALLGCCPFPSFRQGIVKRHLVGNFLKDVALLENQVPLQILRAILRALQPSFTVTPEPVTRQRSAPSSFQSEAGSGKCWTSADADLGRPFEGGEAAGADLDQILRVAVKLVYPFIEPSPTSGASSTVGKSGSMFLKSFCDTNKISLQQSSHIFDYIYQVISGATSHSEKVQEHVALDLVDFRRSIVVSPVEIERKKSKHQRVESTKLTTWVSNEDGAHKVTRVFSKLANLPRASDLQKVGITFKPTKLPSLAEVKYDKQTKTVHLPRLEFYDHTAALFRNLATYEQLSKPNQTQVLSYLQFMDYLIDTQDDVALLSKCDVLKNNVGSDKILAERWNTIRLGLTPTEMTERWEQIHDDIIEHCNITWHTWKVELRNTYFSRPWYVASFIIFIIVTLATLIQTVIAFVQM